MPLPGTLNAQGYSPTPLPTGLSLPGQGPVSQPQREMTLGQMGNVGLQGIGASLSIPRLMAWNAGPAMVGRSGEGPQNGAELLGRLGMNQQGPAAQGLGAGLDLLADPMNLVVLGAARGASAPSALTRRLEQMAGSGLGDAAAAEGARVAAANPETLRRLGVTVPAPPRPSSPFAATRPTGVSPPAPVPYRPVTSFPEAPGSPSFLQSPTGPYPSFSTPLTTERFLNPPSNPLMNRLRQMAAPARTADAY